MVTLIRQHKQEALLFLGLPLVLAIWFRFIWSMDGLLLFLLNFRLIEWDTHYIFHSGISLYFQNYVMRYLLFFLPEDARNMNAAYNNHWIVTIPALASIWPIVRRSTNTLLILLWKFLMVRTVVSTLYSVVYFWLLFQEHELINDAILVVVDTVIILWFARKASDVSLSYSYLFILLWTLNLSIGIPLVPAIWIFYGGQLPWHLGYTTAIDVFASISFNLVAFHAFVRWDFYSTNAKTIALLSLVAIIFVESIVWTLSLYWTLVRLGDVTSSLLTIAMTYVPPFALIHAFYYFRKRSCQQSSQC